MKKSIVLAAFYLISGYVSAQNTTLIARRNYISLAFEGAFRTGTEISSNATPTLLQTYNRPAGTIGFDYTRITGRGFILSSGIHYLSMPASFKFDIPYNNLNGSSSPTGNFSVKESISMIHNVYVPLYLGYQFKKSLAGFQPSISAGVNANIPVGGSTTGSISSGTSEVFRLNFPTGSADGNIRLTYGTSIRFTRSFGNGDAVYFGLSDVISKADPISSNYTFSLKSGQQTGQYKETASYFGVQLGFSYMTNKRKLNINMVGKKRQIVPEEKQRKNKKVAAK